MRGTRDGEGRGALKLWHRGPGSNRDADLLGGERVLGFVDQRFESAVNRGAARLSKQVRDGLIGTQQRVSGYYAKGLHFGTERAESKDTAPSFTDDPAGLLTWHSDIRASLEVPPSGELEAKRQPIVAVIRAWLAHA